MELTSYAYNHAFPRFVLVFDYRAIESRLARLYRHPHTSALIWTADVLAWLAGRLATRNVVTVAGNGRRATFLRSRLRLPSTYG